ncbi:fluoride efflux transporter FluC [Luteococcus sp. OSA5]|uniref:fluoride efflux transporter FluC n=1 Tax=Luteococcus sp. OSA5 TaxID=3401630 RepID=UPI003B432E6E
MIHHSAAGEPAVAVHRQPVALAAVLLGGMAGTLARWAVGRWLPALAGWPLATLLVNLTGAFCLGWLLAALRRSGPDEAGRRVVRLLLGTGFLGSFTTMSALAVELVLLARQAQWATALGYLGTSLLGGAVLACCGVLVAERGRGEHR